MYIMKRKEGGRKEGKGEEIIREGFFSTTSIDWGQDYD